MSRLADVRPAAASTERSRVLLDPQLADLFRRICKYLGREPDDVFEEALELFVRERTNLELTYKADASAPSPTTKNEGSERRTAERRGTKRPVPGSDDPRITRRKSKDRRSKD